MKQHQDPTLSFCRAPLKTLSDPCFLTRQMSLLIICSEIVFHPTSLSRKLDNTCLSERANTRADLRGLPLTGLAVLGASGQRSSILSCRFCQNLDQDGEYQEPEQANMTRSVLTDITRLERTQLLFEIVLEAKPIIWLFICWFLLGWLNLLEPVLHF